MPDIFDIIRKRWPEVVLIVVFQTGLILLGTQLMERFSGPVDSSGMPAGPQMSEGGAVVLGLGTGVFLVVSQMLFLGFLATAHSRGCEPQQPAYLMKVGRYYFWRIFRFEFVYQAAMAVVFTMISEALNTRFFNVEDTRDFPIWVTPVITFAALAIFAKPGLLTPAIMIAQDRMGFEAFSTLGRYRLLGAVNLVRLLFICFAGQSLFLLGQNATASGSFSHTLLVAASAVATSIFSIVLLLMALRYVTSQFPTEVTKNTEEEAEIER